MEQRTLRLGDIVDDYCPRERRVTNHAIVAIVGDAVRRTRCSTCDTEHEYKEAKVPKKKTRTASGEVGSELAGGVLVTAKPALHDAVEIHEPSAVPATEDPAEPAAMVAAPEGVDVLEPDDPASEEPARDGGFSHRPLIRATLPRVDGDPPPPRPIPEFTMHQRPGRGFGGRGFRQGPPGSSNGGQNRSGNDPDGNRGPNPGRHGRRRRRRRAR